MNEMPTDPFKQLFYLELSTAAAKDRIDPAVTLLEEIRNYGHMLFARCAYRPEGGDENIPILFLYYHLLEMLDAVGVLIAESDPVPAELQVRPMFDALVSLSFILKADTARRAHRYLVGAFTERIRFCETLDPSTPAGQRYRQALESDPNCAWVRPETPRPEAIERLKSGLTQPGYAEVYAGYQR